MNCAPDWILSTTISVLTLRYVDSHIPIDAFVNKFSQQFEGLYDDLTSEKLELGTEKIMRFLATFETNDHLKIVNSHIFHTINFEKIGKKRKLKGIFFNAMSPQRNETKLSEVIRLFQTYTFQLRSNSELAAPTSWQLSDSKGIDNLLTIFTEPVHVMDAF